MDDKLAEWVDQRVSRRGMLGKTGRFMAVVGLGMLGGAIRPSAAGATPLCCTLAGGTECLGCGGQPVGSCPAPYTYTGYTWGCCYGERIAWCWDCVCNTTYCTCTRLSGALC
jgi:hypothetical protein